MYHVLDLSFPATFFVHICPHGKGTCSAPGDRICADFPDVAKLLHPVKCRLFREYTRVSGIAKGSGGHADLRSETGKSYRFSPYAFNCKDSSI